MPPLTQPSLHAHAPSGTARCHRYPAMGSRVLARNPAVSVGHSAHLSVCWLASGSARHLPVKANPSIEQLINRPAHDSIAGCGAHSARHANLLSTRSVSLSVCRWMGVSVDRATSFDRPAHQTVQVSRRTSAAVTQRWAVQYRAVWWVYIAAKHTYI